MRDCRGVAVWKILDSVGSRLQATEYNSQPAPAKISENLFFRPLHLVSALGKEATQEWRNAEELRPSAPPIHFAWLET